MTKIAFYHLYSKTEPEKRPAPMALVQWVGHGIVKSRALKAFVKLFRPNRFLS